MHETNTHATIFIRLPVLKRITKEMKYNFTHMYVNEKGSHSVHSRYNVASCTQLHSGCLTDQQVSFPGVSGRHLEENSVEFEVSETVNFNLNEEACGDRLHPMPITVSSNHH